jgi:hypothetical protein
MGRVGVPGGGEVLLTPGHHDEWTAEEVKIWLVESGVFEVRAFTIRWMSVYVPTACALSLCQHSSLQVPAGSRRFVAAPNDIGDRATCMMSLSQSVSACCEVICACSLAASLAGATTT